MYTTASGIQVPQGPDSFSPTAQFKDWADGEAVFDNFLNVNLDSERTALSAPKLRDGVFCWVRATSTLWVYQGTTWRTNAAEVANTTDFLASTQLASATTAMTKTFPSLPYATTVELTWLGTMINATGTTQTARLNFNASAGTVTQSSTAPVSALASSWAAYVLGGTLVIPTSTAVTLTITTLASGTINYDGMLRTRRLVS